jgi:uncharacterized membrane protein
MAPTRRLPRRRTAAILAVAVLFIVGACSSKNATTTVSPAEAAATVASAYSLPDDQRSCLEHAFRDHPQAARPLATARTADDSDLQALGDAENSCIQVGTLADAVTSGAADGFGSITDQQRTCLNDSINGLSTDDRVTLLVGFTVPQSLGDAKSTELGRVTNGILDTCHLSIDSTATTAG